MGVVKKNYKMYVIYFIFLQACWPSLVSLVHLLESRIPQRNPSLLTFFQLVPNSLVFDRPQFFRKGDFFIIFADGSKQALPFNSTFIQKTSTFQRSVIVYHSVLSPQMSGEYPLIRSALRYLFCNGHLESEDLNPSKKIDQIEFQFYEMAKPKDMVNISLKC